MNDFEKKISYLIDQAKDAAYRNNSHILFTKLLESVIVMSETVTEMLKATKDSVAPKAEETKKPKAETETPE